MTFNQVKMALYATYLTNYYGYKIKKSVNFSQIKALRIEYSQKLLHKLDLQVKVINAEKVPQDGNYLLVSNHRSVIDPLIIENALTKSKIFGYWVAKKELYNSFFFGLFVRNAGTILLDRENAQMKSFMSDIKDVVKEEHSIFIFPEGTRNKLTAGLGTFKEGSKIIALKNRLDILPVYIRDNADDFLKSSLEKGIKDGVIEIEIGDIISYRDKSATLEEQFKKQFNIP